MSAATVARVMRDWRRSLVLGAVVIAFGVGVPASYAGGGVGQHTAITITSNADFSTCGCVVSGKGTQASPYVIGPWAISAPNPGNDPDPIAVGSAITVDNTPTPTNPSPITDYFTITGISINYDETSLPPNPVYPVIYLRDVQQSTTISNVSANDDGIGIKLDGSSNITLDSVSVNKMNGAGLWLDGSSNITSINGKYKATSDGLPPSSHDADGLYAENSSNLHIGGVAGCPKNGICNTFDYDSGWGVYLPNTSNVVIENASANVDDTGGFVLDGRNHVTLDNSGAEAGGPICISANGAKETSGYLPTDLVGGLMLVNGTSDDTISNDTFNGTSSSSGFSIGDGANGGVNNPFYFDVCMNMQQLLTPPGDPPMGSNIKFSNVCYTTTDIPSSPGLPPTSSCKS